MNNWDMTLDLAREAGGKMAGRVHGRRITLDADQLDTQARQWAHENAREEKREGVRERFLRAFHKEYERLEALGAHQHPFRIALVSCGAAKADHPCKARDLYTSDLFRKSLAWAELQADRVFILSARYGAVAPDHELPPYNFMITQLSKVERVQWAHCCVFGGCTIGEAGEGRSLLLLAGEEYARYVRPEATEKGWVVHEPLAGLQVGERLSWLKKSLAGADAVAGAAGHAASPQLTMAW